MMRAAIVRRFGVPEFGEAPEPPSDSGVLVDVLAAPINNIDRLMAAGGHPSSFTALPAIAGADGVGKLADGRLVYFHAPIPPFGSMAERVVVDPAHLIELPEGSDPILGAAVGNLALAGWLPWDVSPRGIDGGTVVILGAGGVVGTFAVWTAARRGAGRIVAVVRDEEQAVRLRQTPAHVVITTEGKDTQMIADELADASAGAIDVVLDYVWGPTAAAAIRALTEGSHLIQIGTAGPDSTEISSLAIRTRGASVSGFGPRFVSSTARSYAHREVLAQASRGELPVDVRVAELEDVASEWNRRAGATRVVLVP